MNACACIVAWHLHPDLFESLGHVPGLDVYLLSHRSPGELPDWLGRFVPPERILTRPNLGYDWGGYEQFIRSGIYREYAEVFFLHDDLRILDPQVFSLCSEIIRSKGGDCVIGNGRQTRKRDWPRTHVHCYAHSHWKPPGWDFCHDVVRGSFLATSSRALEKIEAFEVLWDRRGLIGVGAGNWSLRATCGKMEAILGEGSFHYLSETYLTSPYLLEMERGQEGSPRRTTSLAWRLRNRSIVGLSRFLMTRYLDAPNPATRERYARLMEGLFARL